MKTATLTLLTLICFSGINAQYKKASFFEKEGRTYGLSVESHFLGGGRKTAPGFAVSFGRDQSGKQLFTFTDIRVLPSFKFTHETFDEYSNPITVNGKSKLHLIYALNYGYYLLNNDDEERKVKPYVTAGLNFVILGGMKELENPDYSWNAAKKTPGGQFSAGIGGGVGTVLHLSSLLGIKVEGGYTYQFNFTSEYTNNQNLYYMYVPHPYASLGLRFRIESE